MLAQRERRRVLRWVLSTAVFGATLQGPNPLAWAQETRPAPTSQPGDLPTTRVAFNFNNTQIVAVLEKLSSDYGFEIAVNEAGNDTRVDVIAKQPIPAEEALKVLNSALKSKEFVIVRMGRILKVLTRSHAKEAPPVFYGSDPEAIPDTDDLRTQVMAVGSLDAVKLRQDLTPIVSSSTNLMANAASNSLVVTDTSNAIKRIATIITSMNLHRAEDSDLRVIQLKYADADATARLITTMFGPQQQPQGGFPGFGGFGRGGPGGGGGGRNGGGGGGRGSGGGNPFAALFAGGAQAQEEGSEGTVQAAADTRTNTVVVSGPKKSIEKIVKMLKDLDANPQETSTFFLYRVKNGQAIDMMQTLNGLFQQTGITGSTNRGGTFGGNNNRGGFGGGG
ncbi:MAG TPA: secretin N-terminal domain-containing protein, partial [Tepidisphaeraceae bacterium]